jgi:hypothetical protein
VVRALCQNINSTKTSQFILLTVKPFGFKIAKYKVFDLGVYGSKWRDLLREGLLLLVATEEWITRKTTKTPGVKMVKDVKRATRRHSS